MTPEWRQTEAFSSERQIAGSLRRDGGLGLAAYTKEDFLVTAEDRMAYLSQDGRLILYVAIFLWNTDRAFHEVQIGSRGRMRRLIYTAITCLFAITPFANAQNPYSEWLKTMKWTGVPFGDETSVVPGMTYVVSSQGVQENGLTDKALNFPIKKTTTNLPMTKITLQKSRSGGATFFSVGKENVSSLEVAPTTLTCLGANAANGKELDHLVYQDPDFKESNEGSIDRYHAVLLVERVCFAQKFSLTSSSSSEFLASINKADIKACSEDASAKRLADTISSSTTIGDLIAALKNPLANIAVGFTACNSATGTVELNSQVPQAVAMKTWRVFECTDMANKNTCNNHRKDPNQLDYDQESRPELF